MYPHSHYRGLRRRMKGPEKIFKDKIAENILNMGKEIVNQVQEVQSTTQDGPKGKYAKAHSNLNDEN